MYAIGLQTSNETMNRFLNTVTPPERPERAGTFRGRAPSSTVAAVESSVVAKTSHRNIPPAFNTHFIVVPGKNSGWDATCVYCNGFWAQMRPKRAEAHSSCNNME